MIAYSDASEPSMPELIRNRREHARKFFYPLTFTIRCIETQIREAGHVEGRGYNVL